MPKKKKTDQKVDLTERPTQGGGAQRRESAQSESNFELFDDDPQATSQAATPNPEHRRPTIKGMGFKVAKILGLSKGSISSTPEAQPPSDDTSDARGSNSGSEQSPSLSLSPVMTHKASPRSPTSNLSVTNSSPLADALLSPDGDDNKTDAQKLEEFRQETQLLRTNLQELQATNDRLTQAIKIALSEQSVSETGVMESAETAKKLVHMKTMYLQQLNKAMEAQEALEASKEEIKKLTLKLDTSKKSLTEKVKDKDHELQQLQRCSAISVQHPPTFSVDEDDLPDDTDPMVYIGELKAALQSKKEQIESLHCQVNSFEQIATQRQQLQSNSKIQSMVVVKLKKRLETVETELELARKNAERMANTNTELADLQQEKEDIEDDKHCLEMEMSAERERLQDVMKQLADSQSAVKSMEKTLRARPGNTPVSEDDKDREIQMLKSEVHLAQIEIKGHRQNAEKSRKNVVDIEKQRQTLERRLARANQERDSLANQVLKVQVESRTLKSRLTSVGVEHEAAIEIAESLTKAIENKDSEATDLRLEKMELEEKLKQSDNELQIVQIQAQQYMEDFKQERHDRENAFSIKDDNFGKFQVQVQKLRDELKGSQEMSRNERREKQEVIANLKVAIKERQQKQSQLAQAHNDFEVFLQLKDKEVKQLTEEKQKLSIKYENQLKQVGIQNMQLQTKLKKKIDQLQATLQELTETGTAEKLSLENQLDETTRECKLKIAANEKAAMTDDTAQAKATSGRMGVELQAARERLEIAIADTASLHDEVMAKTAQVKQYKKQTDSFKAKVEEANTKLLKTQRELQRCQELIITMEEDNQYQIEQVKASAESDKLAAVSDLIQTRKQYILMVEDKTRELETLQCDWEQFNDKQTQRIYELERTLQDLSARQQSSDELVPYCLPRLPALGEQQGSGSYGSVYRIQLNGISCIAKRIHDILLGQGKEKGVNIEDKQAAYQKFYSECVLLSRMRHPNIVQFMGVYYGPQRDYGRELTLVMERLYMNLENCLEQYQNIVTWLKVSILLDVSQGLLHLHSQGIVHRDLTAANILLTTSFHAKIADLGVSKIINVHPLAASKQSMIPGTLGYMPPEALAEIPEYGYALDIFSFGVLILFVLLQEYPQYYENFVTVTGFQRKETQIQKRMKWIAKLSPEDPMRQLICQCLQDEPEQRPTTTELNSNLIPFARHFPKPYVDTIDMQRNLKLTTSPISLPRQLSQGQNLV